MRLFFGILFILIGVMVFTGSFQWDIFVNALDNLFQAWPFIFVLIGFSVLSKIKGLHWLKYFHALLAIAFFLFLFLWPSKNVTEAKIAHMPVDVLLTEEYQDYSIEIKGNAYGFFITEATETSAKRITGEIAGYKKVFVLNSSKTSYRSDWTNRIPAIFSVLRPTESTWFCLKGILTGSSRRGASLKLI